MIKVSVTGSYKKTQEWLNKLHEGDHFDVLGAHGSAGVSALASATPKDTGKTASSWTYVVFNKGNKAGVAWYNSNVVNGVPIAIILDNGHGTGTGGWVPGHNYISPAIKPIMDKTIDDVWKKVIE